MKTTLSISIDIATPDELARVQSLLATLAGNDDSVDDLAGGGEVVAADKPKRGRPRKDAGATVGAAPPAPVGSADPMGDLLGEAPKPAAPAVSLDDLKLALRKVCEAKGLDAVKASFQKFGAGSLPEIKAENYAGLLAHLRALVG